MEMKLVFVVNAILFGIVLINIWFLNKNFPFIYTRNWSTRNIKRDLQLRSDTWSEMKPPPEENLQVNVTQNSLITSVKLHLIIQFPVIVNNTRAHINSTQLIDRQNEYIDTLQRNLLHPLVSEVHVLQQNVKDKDFIQNQNLKHFHKLRFHYLGRQLHYSDAFEYASLYLQHKITIIINADCYIGKGFEKIDDSKLGDVVYALTRHESFSSNQNCSTLDFCGPGAKYIGSHDAFVFKLSAKVSQKLLKRIDFRSNMVSIERVLIYNLRQYENFTIRNPCKTLYILHNHCSKYRITKERFIGNEKLRLDRYLKMDGIPFWKFTAPFSDL